MPDLDDHLADRGQSGLFTRLARVGLLLDDFQHRTLDAFGLRFVDFSVLRVIELGGPMSPSDLAELTLRSTGGMTQIVDRLEREGLVRRTADRADRRRVVVTLTPKGRRLATRAQQAYARERDRVLAPLTATELADVDAAVQRLLGLLSDEAESAEAAS
jgi:MarR family 2-MHQ and catechol resistance regulon transcriptional repressor